ncbi:MAG: beta-N-acetylhexosaminidase [Kiritimatiellae bacterium]|nr:beta-N-acetylhexosaminidase [Kiritimatiellia bacterium]
MRSIGFAASCAAGLTALSACAGTDVVPRPLGIVERGGVYEFTGRLEDAVRFRRVSGIPAEGYRMSVSKDGAEVVFGDDAGRLYALETLRQMVETVGDGGVVPCVEIEDAPRYAWRGVHLDESRHFFGKAAVKRILDLMARHKLNRFHWHLTDDQGWRIDVPGYPELVRYGAVRPSSVRPRERAYGDASADAEKYDGVAYGPYFYTEADLREVIEYAAKLNIQIVPEIELPGHVCAALAAYPQFACHPERLASRRPRISWGIEKDVLCAGNDEAIKFMEDVLDWTCRVFPCDVVHIGGDECPQDAWKTCAKCRARIEAEGLGDEKGLQPWITRRFVRFLAERGKRAIGWDECLVGDVPSSAMGMSWRESRIGAGHELVSGAAAAMRGHDMVMTPSTYCYLDYAQGLADDPHFYSRHVLKLERCYAFDPCAGVPNEAKRRVLGGQGNNWTEFTLDQRELDWKMWPRMMALAEALWLGESKPGFEDFRRRAARQRERLVASGVNCAPLE